MRKKKEKYRIISFVKEDELKFLDDMARDLYFKYGINIPRTKLVEEMIQACQDMASQNKKALEDELAKRFKEAEKGIKEQLDK